MRDEATRARWFARLRSESGGAIMLLTVTAIALLLANSPLSQSYAEFWETPLVVALGEERLELSLHHWVNDGLMVLFFLLIGLEVRQELAVGSLRDRTRAIAPLVAGAAGVALPALLFLVIAGRDAPQAWGAVVGTDTAFLLGTLALVGPSMSNQLRMFLLTLTVVDDFLAVLIVGVVYSDDVRIWPLVIAAACLVLLWLLGRLREWRTAPYVLVVVVLWLATLLSGIHPSIAGMAAGLLIPSFAPDRQGVVRAKRLFVSYWQSPEASVARDAQRGLSRSIAVSERFSNALRTPVSLVIVPVFALANAGIDLRGDAIPEAIGSSVMWGIVVGLVVGKLVGIAGGTWLIVRFGWGRLPDGVGFGSVMGGAALSGIGFTMSLLIVGLAFDTAEERRPAVVGVLLAMVLAGLLGWLIFAVARRRFGETAADLPLTLTPAVHEHDHARGPADAPHTVVEYLDFECPFCAEATGMWRQVEERFGDRVRYVVRHLPMEDLHPAAWRSAIAAEAAGRQGRFWEMHDLLFANQSALGPRDLRRYAGQLGLDLEQFEADCEDDLLAGRVRLHAQSAHDSGARGTPTFFIDGVRHRGPHDARTLIAAIEAIGAQPRTIGS
ncbi:Na+/H+ antiporter NhaA [Agrococcus sp. ARC_14]|uniref:Na+/H+ antiporter NhaA n=1 Tax=Agrococcus sp. ARC_14 TaxID=2919927 RepID=UPI001F063E82|nr:Na+/H+ antiporter NhaA [Agrococcus sp. ARC_14]MCH1881548.1 Na+/H+ antiporter NhaA [Agrococcus sp. ARC_14]